MQFSPIRYMNCQEGEAKLLAKNEVTDSNLLKLFDELLALKLQGDYSFLEVVLKVFYIARSKTIFMWKF